jgi:hypothetical protein
MRRKVYSVTGAINAAASCFGASKAHILVANLSDLASTVKVYGIEYRDWTYDNDMLFASLGYGNPALGVIKAGADTYQALGHGAITQWYPLRSAAIASTSVPHNEPSWTVECICYLTSVAGVQCLWSSAYDSTHVYALIVNAGVLQFYDSGVYYSFQSINANVYHHIAVSRSTAPGGVITVYLDGTGSPATLPGTETVLPAGGLFAMGCGVNTLPFTNNPTLGYCGHYYAFIPALNDYKIWEHWQDLSNQEQLILITSGNMAGSLLGQGNQTGFGCELGDYLPLPSNIQIYTTQNANIKIILIGD